MSLLAQLAAQKQQLERDKYLMTPQYSSAMKSSSSNSQSRQSQPSVLPDDIWADSNAADARAAASRADSDSYAEGKLREQQGRGLASTGEKYSDARLRDQLGLPPEGTKPEHPLENYLGGVKSQEEYRTSMMQYIASGGKKPKWYTGNFETDQPNIEAAIGATMTPQQRMQRDEVKVRQEDLNETRDARIQAAKDSAVERQREQAAKQEGIKQKAATVTREDKVTAHNVLGGVLGADYAKTPKVMLDAVAARVAAGAKKMLNKPEAKDADIEELMSEEIDHMIQRGELKMPDKGTFIGRWADTLTFGASDYLFGGAATPTEFIPKGNEQPKTEQEAEAKNKANASKAGEDWIARARAHPKNASVSLEAIIAQGKQLGKIR